jgi:hypothetical protein
VAAADTDGVVSCNETAAHINCNFISAHVIVIVIVVVVVVVVVVVICITACACFTASSQRSFTAAGAYCSRRA